MEPAIEDEPRELRIAPVMTGGTSLAVWMGGATLELYRVTRVHAEPGVVDDGLAIYRRLLELTHTRAVVDVITGTSAGGLNGSLLAAAQTFEASIDGFAAIRETWQETADIDDLLRSRKEVDPPSLLRGDDYFEPKIKAVLSTFESQRPPAPAQEAGRDRDHDVDLVTTLTSIVPVKKTRFDAFGEAIVQGDHAHRLRFTGEQIRATDADIVSKMAIAARTSAGIPGVFEPSFIPVGEADAAASKRPNFRPHASFGFSRWAVDGGVVVNLPLTEALDRVYDRTAAGEVRRVILYVNPTPAVETRDQTVPFAPRPTLRASVATVVTAPRAEGISDDLDQIDRRNRQIDRQIQIRVALGALGSTIKLSGANYVVYRRQRAMAVERLVAAAFDANPALGDREGLTQKLVASRMALFPQASDQIDRPPIGGFPGRRWGWGIDPLDHSTSTALGLVSRALALTSRTTDGQRRPLLAIKAGLHHYRARLAAVRALDEQFWARRFQALAAGTDHGDADHWHGSWPYADADDLALGALLFARAQAPNAAAAAATAASAGLAGAASGQGETGRPKETPREVAMQYPGAVALGPAPGGDSGSGGVDDPVESARNAVFEVMRGAHFETARLMIEAAPVIAEIVAEAQASVGLVTGLVDDPARRTAQVLDEEASALASETASIVPDGAEKAAVAARFLRLHQVQVLLLGDVIQREQRATLVQLSSNPPTVPSRLANRSSAAKLAGPELARLGAFLKPSWRANDWFWGRMDAAHRLVLLLLDTQELKRQGNVGEFVEWVQGLSEEPLPRPVAEELDALETAVLPGDLPHTAAFLAEQVQLAIARTELPLIADAIEATIERGGNEVDRGRFRRAVRAAYSGTAPGSGLALSDQVIARLVDELKVGGETLSSELGYGLLTRVASRAVAVTVNTLSAPSAGLALAGRLLRPVRAPVQAVTALFEMLTALDPARRAIAAFLVAIAGAVLALRLVGGDVPSVLVAASSAVFVILAVTAALRVGVWKSALVLALAGLVLTLTLVGPDLRTVLYDELLPTTTTQTAAGSSLTVDGAGVLRLSTDGEAGRIIDQTLARGDVVTFRSTGGTLVGPDTTSHTQGGKQVLFLGGPHWIDPPPPLRSMFGGNRGPLSISGLAILVALWLAARRCSRGRRAALGVAGVLALTLLPLAWSTLLTGAEPVGRSGWKGWMVAFASSLHDAGLVLLLVLFVGAGVLLTLGHDHLRDRLKRNP